MSYTPTEWESTDVVTATRMNALETAVGDMNMSYTPNVWSDGDILSAEKMNALEQAVASGGGDSSDFSTAQVTIVTNDSFRLSNSVMLDEMDDVMITDVFFESYDYPLVLYKGRYDANIIAPDETSITSATGSGGVSVSTNPFGGYRVTITGDGTLNVTVEAE